MALQYGTSTALTITAGSLAVGATRSSAAVTSGVTNNTTDYLISVNVLTTTTAATVNKQVVVYAYRSEDGTNYSGASSTIDNVDGTDKTLTAIGSPSNLTFLGTIQLNNTVGGTTYALTLRQVFSLAQAFGSIPPKWGIVLLNDNGAAALGATVTATYREVYYS
jgi:hypothetical protein